MLVKYANNPLIISQSYTPLATIMIIKPETYLLGSILLETCATCGLKYTLKNKFWYIPVYMGYGVSFYIFPKSLVKYSLSTAYTIWCGVGLILTTTVDILIYKELLTIRKFLGLLAVIIGIKITK
ncbi:quaternary amonium transporter [Chrysochromulina ericina virus CeV-01B]|uniref:Quaternary amonium transporter n=1 Tax=Chrysochromulina ericina virus CeV-01B TaxID=3070830 RepID=A0A0N9Q9B0_9VIRU|nr:quaternary amonium transporter [Chrysochromulina ericina virus]ALH23058.1 quaternary amonium transporter [Chrysochromulina ericina virus CeV-01B]